MIVVLMMMTALLAEQPASSSAAALDFELFKSEVQPVFLEKRTGFTRCVVCHAGDGRVGFLESLSSGATTWNEEQSRLNFEAVSRLEFPSADRFIVEVHDLHIGEENTKVLEIGHTRKK